MKKTLLYILLISSMMVFMFGCDKTRKTTDSGDNTTQNPGGNPDVGNPDPDNPDPENPTPTPSPATPINKDDLATLKGTYNVDALLANITVRYTNDNDISITFSDNCSAIQLINPSAACFSNDNVISASQVVIDGDSATTMVLQAKTQVWGGNFAGADASLKTYGYTYMKSGFITVKAPSVIPPQPNELVPFAESKGFNSRNMDTRIDLEQFMSGGQYNLLDDGRLLIDNTLNTSTNYRIQVTLILTKTTDDTAIVDSNVLVNPSAQGFDASGFKTNAEIDFTPNAPITLEP